MTDLIKRTCEALKANGFTVEMFATGKEAADFVLRQIAPGETVGIGGSVTIRELGLGESLLEKGHTVYSHWFTPGDSNVYLNAGRADVYLCSSNAVTATGQLVNIDGTGNRVAAMIYGPKRVFMIVGRNKLVDGGIPSAIARIKREACPKNARRLGRNTPCADAGCDVSKCQKGMCNVTSVLEHPTGAHPIIVVLVEEELGY